MISSLSPLPFRIPKRLIFLHPGRYSTLLGCGPLTARLSHLPTCTSHTSRLVLEMVPVFAAVSATHLMLATIAQVANFDFTTAARTYVTDPSFVAYAMVLCSCLTFTHDV
jgi:hypothetical protein